MQIYNRKDYISQQLFCEKIRSIDVIIGDYYLKIREKEKRDNSMTNNERKQKKPLNEGRIVSSIES